VNLYRRAQQQREVDDPRIDLITAPQDTPGSRQSCISGSTSITPRHQVPPLAACNGIVTLVDTQSLSNMWGILYPASKETQVLVQRVKTPFGSTAPITSIPGFDQRHRRRELARRIVTAISVVATHVLSGLVGLGFSPGRQTKLGDARTVRRLGILVLTVVFAFAAAGGTAGAALKPLPITGRLIQHGEFPPFVSLPGQSTTLYKTPKQWVDVDTSLSAAQALAETTRLSGEGFVAVLSRQLGTIKQEPWGGLSWVMQLRSAVSAKAELAANVQDAITTNKPPNSYTAFKVRGIPDARGYYLTSLGGDGDNVVFTMGPYLYFLGVGWSSKPKNTPTEAQLVAAATRLYKRIKGHPST
jgi:hypothetical protein